MGSLDFPRISWMVLLIIFTASCGESYRNSDIGKAGGKVAAQVGGADTTAIPTIRIETIGPIPWDRKVPAIITYADCGRTWTDTADAKYRGGMSSKYDKPSYTIELAGNYRPANLPADDDWILNANYIDKSFMRHKISYDLFQQMGSYDIAPQSGYVELWQDENYFGLYVVMEKINAGMLGLDKSDHEAMVFKDPPLFYRERTSAMRDTANYFGQRYPKMEKRDQTTKIEALQRFLFESSDAAFLENVGKWIDLRNVMDWHLFVLFANNGDGIMKNFYLYKRRSSEPFRIAVWDCDHTFGRDGDNEMNMLERVVDGRRSILLQRLMDTPRSDYPNALRLRWMELRDSGVFSLEQFEEMVAENRATIAGALARNFERWPVNAKWYYDDNTFEDEIELMIRFVELRLDQLDARFSEAPKVN